jgi:hypothetical protein
VRLGGAASEQQPPRSCRNAWVNLTVDVFDGTKQLIFRGMASDSLSGNPEKNDRKMERSVEEMFKKNTSRSGSD